MLLKAKKLISVILAFSFIAVNTARAQETFFGARLTIDAQINNDTGKVSLEGEHNSHLSEVVSVTVFYPGYSAESFDDETPIDKIVALMAEVAPKDGTWNYEFTLTDDMPWGVYTIYAGSDVYSYENLFDTVSFINSERKGGIISEFNIGEDKVKNLTDSFVEHSEVLSIKMRNDWESVGNSVSLCFIKLRELNFDKGKLLSFSDIKNTYESASEIYDFMQINDAESLKKYINESSSEIGFDAENDEYLLFQEKIIADVLNSMKNTKNADYVEFYNGLREDLIEKTVLYAINNASKGDMDYLLRKYYAEIGVSVTDDYEKFDDIEVAKALYNKGFMSLTEIQTAFEKRIKELSKQSPSKGGGGGGGGSGGGSKPSVVVAAKNETDEAYEKSGTSAEASSFSDVDSGFWGYNAVSILAQRNIVNGFEDNTFAPNSSVTREQFIKIAVSAFDKLLTEGTTEYNFSDVNSDEWYAQYIRRGVSSGLINGVSQELFGTGKTISRQDAAVILYRAIKSKIDEIKIYGDFIDNAQISEYAKTPVYSLRNIEVIAGNGSGRFNPTDTLTRAEAAQMIYNAMKFCDLFN